MTLKRIKTHNIQVHRDIVIDLPETGLIRFAGNNSNGKSVITKVWQDVARNAYTIPKKRLSRITKGQPYGEVTFERYDGVELFYHIHKEASQTYAELRIPGKDPIRRYLADKTIPVLVEKFGIHSEELEGRSLNVFDSDEALLFFKTAHKLNFSMLKHAYRDNKADAALEEFSRVFKEAKDLKGVFEKQLAIAEASKESLTIYDIDAEAEKAKKLRSYAKLLSLLEPLGDIPKLQKVPDVRWLDLTLPELPRFKNPLILDAVLDIEKERLVNIHKDIVSLEEGECPTCHRKFFS